MAFVKSVLAGIAAVIIAAIVGVAAMAISVFSHDFWGGTFGIDALAILFVALLIFAAGFWWQWRRAR